MGRQRKQPSCKAGVVNFFKGDPGEAVGLYVETKVETMNHHRTTVSFKTCAGIDWSPVIEKPLLRKQPLHRILAEAFSMATNCCYCRYVH